MKDSNFLALFLSCIVLIGAVLLYICLLMLCYACSGKTTAGNGLSEAELDKLLTTTGQELGLAAECAVCLDDIEAEQTVRVVPGCNHAFHPQCADTWFLKNPECPVCRNKVDPDFFRSDEAI